MKNILTMKPYLAIPIRDCGEPLVPIAPDLLVFFEPHPYAKLGADYGKASPWMLRKGVAEALVKAQKKLDEERRGWKIKVFDAYRPNTVQMFMVELEFVKQAEIVNIDPKVLKNGSICLFKNDPELYEKLAEKVFRLWALPSDDPDTPPPHSTGAAIDCTLTDSSGMEIDMGSPIDENSDRSLPGYFDASTDAAKNRALIKSIMLGAGFHQNEKEWWHFSFKDQMWAWIERKKSGDNSICAIYGRCE
ncbi:MAG: M15 family metallopeptidase [Alphaproteobacteria bacterium]|nr:M15 family metallopeptidase [Alphaproteobacteria bacterium]